MVQKKDQEGQKGKQVDHERHPVDIEDIGKRNAKATNNEVLSAEMNGIADGQAMPPSKSSGVASSWTDSISTEALDRWINVLTGAAVFSATCFLASSVLYFQRKKL